MGAPAARKGGVERPLVLGAAVLVFMAALAWAGYGPLRVPYAAAVFWAFNAVHVFEATVAWRAACRADPSNAADWALQVRRACTRATPLRPPGSWSQGGLRLSAPCGAALTRPAAR
jgi:hypothetical protein